ncbi:MAG: asparagine synthase-related protein [Candidatus Helarchaeota archaeon]
MKEILNYNFNSADIIDENFKDLFEKIRRDSIFAYVYEKNGKIYAIRDHLGIIPLYYSIKNGDFRFSLNITGLIDNKSKINPFGLKAYLALGTTKIYPLVSNVHIVPPGSVIEINKRTTKCRIIYQYKIKPNKMNISLGNFKKIINKTEQLFIKALKRTLREDRVGLYLSGGIDSGLIGYYLNKLGIRVNAYTSAPWGAISSEIRFAKINAKISEIKNHYIDYLETNKYIESINSIPILYRNPHGTTTSIAIANLWKNSSIGNEKQIFFGQNCDTMTCSVSSQYYSYFCQIVPSFIREKIKMPFNDIIKNYINFRTSGLINNHFFLYNMIDFSNKISKIQLLSIAGMLICHTPGDGEVLSQPAINKNILISNPYYDMDLIEFQLSIPLRYRISFSSESKLFFTLSKKIFQKIALNYFPKNLVKRKKGFTISLNRDALTKQILDNFPTQIYGIELKHDEQRFAAYILIKYFEKYGYNGFI